MNGALPLQLVTPPATADDIFGGQGALFKEQLATAKVYFEYGVGQSTEWVLANTAAEVYAIDTDKAWIQSVIDHQGGHLRRFHAIWVDVGPLAEWGRPRSYARRGGFEHYVKGLWRGDVKPDVVLIDGRFRVACFFQSLLRARPGTRIIFDDYEREVYRVIEEYVPVAARHGRQRMFVVPEKMDRAEIEQMCERFLYVMD